MSHKLNKCKFELFLALKVCLWCTLKGSVLENLMLKTLKSDAFFLVFVKSSIRHILNIMVF